MKIPTWTIAQITEQVLEMSQNLHTSMAVPHTAHVMLQEGYISAIFKNWKCSFLLYKSILKDICVSQVQKEKLYPLIYHINVEMC